MRPDLQIRTRRHVTPRVANNVAEMCGQLFRNSEAYGIPKDFSGLFVGQAIQRRTHGKSKECVSLLMNRYRDGSLLPDTFLMEFEKTEISHFRASLASGNVAENFGGIPLRLIIFSTDNGATISRAVREWQKFSHAENAEMNFFEFTIRNDIAKKSITIHACEITWQAPDLPSLNQQFPI